MTRDDFETWYLTPLLSGGGGGVAPNLHREPDGTYTVAAVQVLWVSWQANEANAVVSGPAQE